MKQRLIFVVLGVAACGFATGTAYAQPAPTLRRSFDLGTLLRGEAPSALLAHGACSGDADAVKRALEKGTDANVTLSQYDTKGPALFLVAACAREPGEKEEDRVEVARLLIEADAELGRTGTIQFPQGMVPMAPHIAAAYTNRPLLLEFLLKQGAAVEEGDRARDGSALLWAAEGACLACVPVLLRHGADIERRNNMALTALFVAAARGDAPMTQALLEGGADPFVKESAGRSVMEAAESPAARKMLEDARRRVIVLYVVWVAAILFALGAAVLYLRRREDPEAS